MSDEHDDELDPAAPSDEVKKAMSRRQPVKGKGAATLSVIEGGKDESAFDLYGGPARPDPPPHDEAPEEGDPDYGRNDEGDIDQPEGLTPEQIEGLRICASLDPNDRDNGRRLVIWYGPNMAYVPGMGWLSWRTSHWQRDEGELDVRLMAQNLVDWIKKEKAFIEYTPAQRRLLDAARPTRKKPIDDRTQAEKDLVAKADQAIAQISKKRSSRESFAVSSGNAGKTAAMLAQAASHKAVDQKILDKDRMKFNTVNGTLTFGRGPDLDQDMTQVEGEEPPVQRIIGQTTFTEQHDRADMITKRAEVIYDPEATCENWHKFLIKMQPDSRMRRFLQVSHAYAMLTGGNDEQLLFYHYGTGANGKSVFLETLGNLAGSYRTVVSPDTITGEGQRGGAQASPDIARLFNTRFVVVEELPRGTPLKDNLIKAVSGGGTMTARFLQKELFEFQPIFTAVLSGNDMPEISGTDFGIWRRVLIILWGETISDDEKLPFGTMMKMFEEERSGILNWLIEGIELYLTFGMKEFVPASVTEFTKDYREERDPVGNFAAAHIRPAEGNKVSAGEMMKGYTAWCEANGFKPWTSTPFGKRLNTLGYKKVRGSLVQYLDVRLVDLPDKFDARGQTPPKDDPADPGHPGI